MKKLRWIFPVLFSVMILHFCAPEVQSAETGWWTSSQSATAFPEVFGTSDPFAWKITDNYDKKVSVAYKFIDGCTVIASEKQTLKIEGVTRYGPGTEISIRFRMKPEINNWASLTVKIADAGMPGLPVTISGAGSLVPYYANLLICNAVGVPVYYYVRGNYSISLNWQDNLRKIIEYEMGSQLRLNQRIISLRYVLRKNSYEIYVNDILANSGELPKDPAIKPAFSIGGNISMQLSPNVELLSVRAKTVDEIKSVFEPVRIDSRLNSGLIDGTTIARDSVPQAGEPVLIKGVPFVFPNKDQRNNDHIDVGKSWFQESYMEGDLQPQWGSLGGRWAGPLNENPARIQFFAPKGRYNALYLIAASDSEKDCVPIITVQFFRPSAGRPENFSVRVPLLTATSSEAIPLPVKLENGKSANLYLVTIPIEPGALAVFDDLEACAFEITKEVKYFRGYPDPTQYSAHSAGLPSSAHVYAMTLERPAVSVEFQPDVFGNVWLEPENPRYNVKLRNITDQARSVNLELSAKSYDGSKIFSHKTIISVPARGEVANPFELKLERYGYHDVSCIVTDGEKTWTEKRSLAWLRKDTRERGDWEIGRGPAFGFWDWGGGHITPPRTEQIRLMALAGAEGDMNPIGHDTEVKKVAEKYKVTSFLFAQAHWTTSGLMNYVDKPEEGEKWFLEQMRKDEIKASPTERPELITFFPEPGIGLVSYCPPADYYGEKYELNEGEMERYKRYERAFVLGATVMKKNWPNVKCLLPWGDPLFCVEFLRRSEDVRKLIDGSGVDMAIFERLPESQMHQVVMHRLYVTREEFRKAGKPNPILAMYEGPCLPTRPGALTFQEQADNWVRIDLLMFAHGVDRLLGGWGCECAGYWGEQHYGGGIINQPPLATPKPSYAALATMTRHVNRKNFDKWLPTESLSVYALQFKHYKTGELTHVLWTIRGKRPVTISAPKDATITMYDQMDNATVLKEKDGVVTFVITPSPCFIYGMTEEMKITLGEPDHSDAVPAPLKAESKPAPQSWALTGHPIMSASDRPPVPKVSSLLGNFGDGTWKLSKERDLTYENNHTFHIARFLGEMSIQPVEAPKEKGNKAIAVHLGKQEKERKLMPYYTTLVPSKAITIPGKASHIGLWVKASSDWGRVVYFLKDSEDERWISVGTKDDWNCDDIHNWSYFCFDGWRYLRFEMPSNSPYDKFREMGSTWWGHFSTDKVKGNGFVDLPLSLEKVVVERRDNAMYVIDPQPTSPEDVLLGDLYAEYESAENQTGEAVRLSKISMPVPAGMPDLGNPIQEMAGTGVCTPTVITKITLPEQEMDGTKCYVHFNPEESAVTYDVWVSPYPDGRGALKLGNAWKQTGQLLTGLRQDTDFYLFVVYTNKDGKASRPSAPYKIQLKDMFGMK